MKIADQITAICQDKFNDMWILEAERMRKMWTKFLAFAEEQKSIKPTKHGRTTNADNYGFRHEDFAIEYVCPGKNYNTMNRSEYNKVVNMRTLTNRIERMTINGYLDSEKKDYYGMLTAKLNGYISEYLTESDEYLQGHVSSSPKGYTIDVAIKRDGQNMNFYTQCFPAGGHNIQCYHFRYKGTLK